MVTSSGGIGTVLFGLGAAPGGGDGVELDDDEAFGEVSGEGAGADADHGDDSAEREHGDAVVGVYLDRVGGEATAPDWWDYIKSRGERWG
jgi:hypothetical protein